MNLRPLGRRVLVRPDAPETETEGGIYIPEQHRDTIAMSGTVVALGPECAGPSYRIKADVLAHVEHVIERVAERVGNDWTEELLADLRAQLSEYYDQSEDGIKVGMGVAFPYTAGTVMPSLMDVGFDGEHYILLDERDIVAAWQPDAATVEIAHE